MTKSHRAALSVPVGDPIVAQPQAALHEPPRRNRPLFERSIVRRALSESFAKLDPRRMIRNPVMFVVEVGSAFTTLLFLHAAFSGHGEAPTGFIFGISAWLWLTVLFANFAEAMAEGRGKAQADSLRKARQTVLAKGLVEPRHAAYAGRSADLAFEGRGRERDDAAGGE